MIDISNNEAALVKMRLQLKEEKVKGEKGFVFVCFVYLSECAVRRLLISSDLSRANGREIADEVNRLGTPPAPI